jgi:hypothetical protein
MVQLSDRVVDVLADDPPTALSGVDAGTAVAGPAWAAPMTMAIELARFTVHEDAGSQLVAQRPVMIKALHKRFPACLAAYLTKDDDGSWLDIVLWRSRDEADEAAREIESVPECAAWFGHIAASGGLRHVEVVDAWSADADGGSPSAEAHGRGH